MSLTVDQQTPPPTSAGLREGLDQETQEFFAIMAELESRGLDANSIALLRTPTTDDELWQEIYDLTGYAIPRVAVCTEHDHVAPFQIFADVFFCRRLDVLMIGNRGGGKTTISGFLHGAKCRWHPGYRSTIVGATQLQAGRGYAEFKRFSRKIQDEIIRSLMQKTTFTNLAEVEVLTGTLKQVNGPHPHLAQFDELELSTLQIFEEFQNMAQGDANYPSQNLLSSTRKFVFGLIQQIVKAAEEDIAEGNTPEWDVMIFCVFETMAQVVNCRRAPENTDRLVEEEALLESRAEFESQLCDCQRWRKGAWEDGRPRTFDTVCRGRAYKARGFQQRIDVLRRFKRLSMEVWEAQQECLRPDPQGLVHKWLAQRHIIPKWYPDPAYGSVFRSWDWGGENPHSVHFSQLLDVPVDLEYRGRTYSFREGDLITFDEIYETGLSYADLAVKVATRTAQWATYGFEFHVAQDICDPAGKTPKKDVKQAMERNGFPAPAWRSRAVPRIESVDKHKEWGGDERLHIVGPMCPWMIEEYAVYHYPPADDARNLPEDPMKVFDHAMDDIRYLIWHLYRLGLGGGSHEAPASAPRASAKAPIDKRSGMRRALGYPERDDSPIAAGRSYRSRNPMGGTVRGNDYPVMPGGTGFLEE